MTDVFGARKREGESDTAEWPTHLEMREYPMASVNEVVTGNCALAGSDPI